jgi:hypothetical protein
MKPIVAFCLVSILSSCARYSEPLSPLAETTPKLTRQAPRATAAASKLAVEARLHRIEATEGARAAAKSAALGREKVAYLLAVLPEQADRSCSDAPAIAASQNDAQAVTAQLEQALTVSDATYDEHQVLSLYQASREKTAQAKALELDCLLAVLDKLGGSEESRREVDQTLKSLEIRENLVVDSGLEKSLSCLDRGVELYQTLIGEDYQQFSRQPVLATQSQLHRDFRGEFEAQIACLQFTAAQRPKTAND